MCTQTVMDIGRLALACCLQKSIVREETEGHLPTRSGHSLLLFYVK